MRFCEKGWAVAAFIPPAHTGFYLAAYETQPMLLPCHCFVIQPPAGTMKNFMCLLQELNRIYGRMCRV